MLAEFTKLIGWRWGSRTLTP